MNLLTLHEVLATELRAKIPSLRAVLCYPGDRSVLEAPVGFLEISPMGIGTDPGTEELPLVLTWTLRILLDSTIENSHIALQSLLIEAAQAVHLNNFGLKMTPASDLDIQYGTLQEAEALLIGSVSWKHELHFGVSQWDCPDGIPPHTLHVQEHLL
ncbi:hypothetical protein AGMMS49949_01510 [Alphaproteobacteria bacterium]|nr:hypothetical protein AGMMS49949_01510 [Alphaproteobacteria bacterium]GHS99096.1 hypothetical protein AGMMS50296_7110 [Alphaproteobacteria bacterium]